MVGMCQRFVLVQYNCVSALQCGEHKMKPRPRQEG
uniref:Uncharacterized protein n=1 Tax=Anguilla anguilla TaxID=7936 RepID=A0A0E9UAI8_ANGAN